MSNVSPAPGFSRPGRRLGPVRCPPALTAPLMPLLSHLPPSGLGPGPGNSQGLEAAEATEHAPMHCFQLVPCQHQLLQAGRSVKGTLSHLLDLIVTQVSGRRGQKRSGRREGMASMLKMFGLQHLCLRKQGAQPPMGRMCGLPV